MGQIKSPSITTALSFAVIIAISSGGPKSQAGTILNTGVPRWQSAFSFSDDGMSAVPFAVSQPTEINSIEAFFYRRTNNPFIFGDDLAGRAELSVYSHGADGFPDQPLHGTTFFVPADGPDAPNWHGAVDLAWSLEPGSYWVAIRGVEGSRSNGGFPYDTQPGTYAWISFFDPIFDPEWRRRDDRRIGIRISGKSLEEIAAPEPYGHHALALPLIGMLRTSRRRRRR